MNDENVIEKFFARGNSYWLTRFVILRLLGFVYAVAFFVAARQLVPLIGHRGLTPADFYLSSIHAELGSRTEGMLHLPTLFWFGCSDLGMSIFAWVGFALSLVVLAGYANAILLAVLWLMYMSIVHVGQDWYGYGWEIQLLETGFLAIFLCPLLDARPFPRRPPPAPIVWCLRWLVFRIMLGAGLIKLRGDACWRDLTCLDYHYETQPIPNPLSRWFHFQPHAAQAASVVYNHVTEVVAPWLLAWPRVASVRSWSSRARTSTIPRTNRPSGGHTSFPASPVFRLARPASCPRSSRVSRGSSGSPRCRRRTATPGRCISCGSFSTAIAP